MRVSVCDEVARDKQNSVVRLLSHRNQNYVAYIYIYIYILLRVIEFVTLHQVGHTFFTYLSFFPPPPGENKKKGLFFLEVSKRHKFH